MEIKKLLRTIYVHSDGQIAILKETSDKTLELVESSIDLKELTEFLRNNSYVI